jgi:glycine oxidase
VTNCLIIGAGVIGLMTARELVRSGVRVTVIERGVAGRESSWAGGGILSPLYPWRAPQAVTQLVQWGQRYYPVLARELLAETGIDVEYTPSGMLHLDVDERDQARRWAGQFKERLEPLSGGALKKSEPALASAVQSALYFPGVAQVRNPRLLSALKASLLQQGVRIEEHCEVTGLALARGKITGVETGRGVIPADQVIVAAGAWSGGLFGAWGGRLNIAPVRGQMILFHARPGLLKHIVVRAEHYLIPRRDGRVLSGSTVEQAGFDRSTTAAALAELKTAALEMVPALAECDIERHWAGLRPGSAHGIPTIAAHPEIGGLYVNSGHFRNGIAQAPASARLMVDMVLDRPAIFDGTVYAMPAESGV